MFGEVLSLGSDFLAVKANDMFPVTRCVFSGEAVSAVVMDREGSLGSSGREVRLRRGRRQARVTGVRPGLWRGLPSGETLLSGP